MKEYSFEEIKEIPIIKEVIDKFNIEDKWIKKNLNTLNRFLSYYIECEKSGPLSECKQKIKGIIYCLNFCNNMFYIESGFCKHWYYENKNYKIKKNMVYVDYDLDKDSEKINDYYKKNHATLNKEQKVLGKKLIEIIENNLNKGIYLYGNSGIGKTYLMKRVANSLADKGKTVIFSSTCNLINEIKDSFEKKNNIENFNLIKKCKKVDVLFMDDIGAEQITDWSRDVLFFDILNYRSDNSKLTFFTSNFSIEELQKLYILKNEDNEIVLKKVLRLFLRIKKLAHEIEIISEKIYNN